MEITGDIVTCPPKNDKPGIRHSFDLAVSTHLKEDIEMIGQPVTAFALKIPEDVFSPAAIQSFLLEHRQSPVDAVAKAEE
ncbi:uncharacterized protein PADG_04608 [Paracoccidioides brasiliensis Pb18]|uniref:Mitochondrial chaperone BCS1-like ATPase lid domain-containing protein n=1 Tax=Paracoccidioides brasiliensis (strain Pb18) TaxID=502780 RepID=C1GC86_PARBD|nr:uncharacterized protein PADG_04608 [Paracoccidioides brasiliensis Pb18]EEH48529.2 hypothetical protein PADG_04608 [Paracoccidioides brasiliensis Pb18]